MLTEEMAKIRTLIDQHRADLAGAEAAGSATDPAGPIPAGRLGGMEPENLRSRIGLA